MRNRHRSCPLFLLSCAPPPRTSAEQRRHHPSPLRSSHLSVTSDLIFLCAPPPSFTTTLSTGVQRMLCSSAPTSSPAGSPGRQASPISRPQRASGSSACGQAQEAAGATSAAVRRQPRKPHAICRAAKRAARLHVSGFFFSSLFSASVLSVRRSAPCRTASPQSHVIGGERMKGQRASGEGGVGQAGAGAPTSTRARLDDVNVAQPARAGAVAVPHLPPVIVHLRGAAEAGRAARAPANAAGRAERSAGLTAAAPRPRWSA